MLTQIHHGYKKCRDNRIVILEILGDNNEERDDIFDKDHAKYRCSKAKVLDIYDMHDRLIKYTNAFGIHDDTFEYKIGDTIEPKNDFDPDPDKTCAPGIHYFLTEEPAYFWNCIPADGPFRSWHDNGRIELVFNYKKLSGDLDFNPTSNSENMLKENMHGEYISYYKNGLPEAVCSYRDGN